MAGILDILAEYWPRLPERRLADHPARGDLGDPRASCWRCRWRWRGCRRTRLISGTATAYSLFFRGTPLLVQIFLIYFGLGQFDIVRSSFLWPFLREAYVCALITFVLNTAAYSAEMVRGGILAVPKGEVEAARACGMSTFTTYRLVILPRAFSIVLPAYSNEVIILMKGTALASTITLLELMGQSQLISSSTYKPIQVFVIAGIIYYLLTLVITWIFRVLERRYNRYLTLAR